MRNGVNSHFNYRNPSGMYLNVVVRWIKGPPRAVFPNQSRPDVNDGAGGAELCWPFLLTLLPFFLQRV